MTRKVIQIALEDDTLLALCDDGTIWEMRDDGTRWHRSPDVPQDDPPQHLAGSAAPGERR